MKILSFHPSSFILHPLVFAGLALAIGARADDTLTLTLPPSRAAREAHAEAARQEAARVTAQRRVAASSRVRQPTPSRGQETWRDSRPAGNVVGTLGVLGPQAVIYRSPHQGAQRLAEPPAGTYVAIRGTVTGWYGVMMVDGTLGWLHAGRVEMLNFEVVSNGAAGMSIMGGSLPGSAQADVYPRSAYPFFTGDARALLTQAYRYLGVPYVWGGNTSSGIDCSGFVRNVFAACSFPLPRLGSDQMAYGIPVPSEQLQAGDRLYFERRTDRVGVKHTGLYIGNGYFIHSSSSQHGVAINRLTESPWRNIYVCARR